MENYEQKYNKLVEAIKVLQKTNPSDEGIQNWVNDNVPELAESEDDKVRKEIIAILQYKYEKFPNDPKYCNAPQWIAWLEKQDQKPAWTEADDEELEIAVDALKGAGQYDSANWLKSLKQRYAWKPSDEQIGVIEAVINNRSFQRRHLDSLYEQLKKLQNESN